MDQVARSGGDVGGCRIDPGRANLWLPQPMWEGGKRREGGGRGRGEQVGGVRTYQAQSAGPVLFPWSRDNEQWGKKLGVS